MSNPEKTALHTDGQVNGHSWIHRVFQKNRESCKFVKPRGFHQELAKLLRSKFGLR